MLVRLLGRTPRSKERNRVLGVLLQLDHRLLEPSKIRTRELPSEEFLAVVEDAATRRQPIRMKYLSARRGDANWRAASVAVVSPGPPSRFLAVCHRSRKLQTFRVDNIQTAHLDPNEAFIESDPSLVERRMRETVDGWFNDKEGVLAFSVRGDDVRWVVRNLLDGMNGEPSSDGSLRVTASAAGLANVARFVAGLGASATCETPELERAVRNLAMGALGADRAKILHSRSVTRIRARG